MAFAFPQQFTGIPQLFPQKAFVQVIFSDSENIPNFDETGEKLLFFVLNCLRYEKSILHSPSFLTRAGFSSCNLSYPIIY